MNHYTEAVREWNRGQDGLRGFAEHAAQVSGKQTAMLADECDCSPSTVENYRNAYRLKYELERQIETPEISQMRERKNPSFWIESAKFYSRYNLSLEKIWEYMCDGQDLTIEAYRTLVANDCDKRPEWLRRLTTIWRKVKSISMGAYISEMPPDVQEEFLDAVDEFAEKLERIVEK